MESTLVDQRKEVRTDLSWPVSMWIPQANRFFNGRSVNVSKGRRLFNIPLTLGAARAGNRVNFPGQRIYLAERPIRPY